MKKGIKIYDPTIPGYWKDEDGQLILYKSVEAAKAAAREEAYKESFIENELQYEEHVEIDKSGYDYQ